MIRWVRRLFSVGKMGEVEAREMGWDEAERATARIRETAAGDAWLRDYKAGKKEGRAWSGRVRARR